MRPSVTKVMNYFEEKGIIKDWRFHVDPENDFKEKDIRFTPRKAIVGIGNEIFGNDARLYIQTLNPDCTRKLMRIVRREFGAKPRYRHDREFELPVSYFKGRRWWE